MKRNLTFDEMDKISNSKKVPFFGLADDGDKAIVRFYHENGDDIQKLAVHDVKIGDNQWSTKVACIKSFNDSTDECPFCDAGISISPRMFIKVLVYTPDKAGRYTNKPELQIWERGKGFKKQLQSLINRYASGKKYFMDTIFEIERNGKKGDTNTRYEIYKVDDLDEDECLLPDPDDIEDIDAIGTIVLDKSFEDMEYFLDNGKFPDSQSSEKSKDKGEEVVRRPRKEEKVEEPEDDDKAPWEDEDEEPIKEEPRHTERRRAGGPTEESVRNESMRRRRI